MNLRKALSSKIIIAILSILILTTSFILYAKATSDEILAHCNNVCDEYWELPLQWMACYDGCLARNVQ